MRCSLIALGLALLSSTTIAQTIEFGGIDYDFKDDFGIASPEFYPVSKQTYLPAQPLPGAINAPDDSYMGRKQIKGPYDPDRCLKACSSKSDYNLRHPRKDGQPPRLCRFVNTYVSVKNGRPQGTVCSFYTRPWGVDRATNFGQSRGDDRYRNEQSLGWTAVSQFI